MNIPFITKRREAKAQQEIRQFFPYIQRAYTSGIFSSAELNPTVDLCVSKVTNTISTLKLKAYIHTANGVREAWWSPIAQLLSDPCIEESYTLFWKTIVRSMLVRGGAYILIGRDPSGNPSYLQFIDPNKVQFSRGSNGERLYNIDGKVYTDYEVMYIPYVGEGFNGDLGRAPTDVHVSVLEQNNLINEYINLYFKQGVGSRLVLTLSPDEFKLGKDNLQKLTVAFHQWFNESVCGNQKAGRQIVLPPSSTLSTVDLPNNVEAEVHSLLHQSDVRIAQMYNIPPSILFKEDNKYNSLESENRTYLESCIMPLCNHIAETMAKALLPDSTNMFLAWDYESLLETDLDHKLDRCVKSVNNGLMTINEARGKLNMGSIDNPTVGDTLFIGANLIPCTEENIKAFMASQKQKLMGDVPSNAQDKVDRLDKNGADIMDKLV